MDHQEQEKSFGAGSVILTGILAVLGFLAVILVFRKRWGSYEKPQEQPTAEAGTPLDNL